jgi:hypothetical protein
MNSPIALTPDLRPSENHMEKREKSVSDLIKTLKNHMGKKRGKRVSVSDRVLEHELYTTSL